MRSLWVNGEGELKRKPVTASSPGKWLLTQCVCDVFTFDNDSVTVRSLGRLCVQANWKNCGRIWTEFSGFTDSWVWHKAIRFWVTLPRESGPWGETYVHVFTGRFVGDISYLQIGSTCRPTKIFVVDMSPTQKDNTFYVCNITVRHFCWHTYTGTRTYRYTHTPF